MKGIVIRALVPTLSAFSVALALCLGCTQIGHYKTLPNLTRILSLLTVTLPIQKNLSSKTIATR